MVPRTALLRCHGRIAATPAAGRLASLSRLPWSALRCLAPFGSLDSQGRGCRGRGPPLSLPAWLAQVSLELQGLQPDVDVLPHPKLVGQGEGAGLPTDLSSLEQVGRRMYVVLAVFLVVGFCVVVVCACVRVEGRGGERGLKRGWQQ